MSASKEEIAPAQQHGAVLAIATYAAEEFERISALSQTLLELMRHPRFYASPALAAAQIASISDIAERAGANVDQLAAGCGVERPDPPAVAIIDAHRAYLAVVRAQ